MPNDPLSIEPNTVDDFRTAIWEKLGRHDIADIDDIIEYIYNHKTLLERWAMEYLV